MATPKPPCVTLPSWLKANLGKKCLAPLTGTDAAALAAAVQIAQLHAYDPGDTGVCRAFRLVVLRMQPKCRFLAYHAIAHVMEWSDRARLWEQAELPPLPATLPECSFAPGGSYIDLSKKKEDAR